MTGIPFASAHSRANLSALIRVGHSPSITHSISCLASTRERVALRKAASRKWRPP